jgi:hypothetical protein
MVTGINKFAKSESKKEKVIDYIDALYKFKIDLLTNGLSESVKRLFTKNNMNGQRLKDMDKWKRDYLNGNTVYIPKELELFAKELKL